MLKFLTIFLLLPALMFSALYENRYFQDRENCLNLKYIGSKKTAEKWYHAFYGQVNGDNEYKYYLYIFRNSDAEPVKFQLAKLNFIEEIQAENFDFAVYQEKEVSFCYKTTKNNLYFYTELRFGDKINPDLFTPYKNSKDSFLYYSQKGNTVIMTPQTAPGGVYHPGISSNICAAFKYGYDNKGQFIVKIALKDRYYITFIKPPYPFPSFEDGASVFDASEKKLPVFDSIENGLTYRIEDYNFQRIGHELSREYHNNTAALFSRKEKRDEALARFLEPGAALASIPDIKEIVKRNLNYYYNDKSDLFVPYRFDLSRFEAGDFIVRPFEEAFRSRFRIQNFNKEFDTFLEFQKNYNSSGPVFKSKNADYLDFYAYLRNFSYSNTAYCTNIKTVQTAFLNHADAVIEDSFTKFQSLLSGFSNGLSGLENLEKNCRNSFYDGLDDGSRSMSSFYDALKDKIPQVLANYQNYLNGVENSGIAVPENLIGKTNTITDDFTRYSLRLLSDYYGGIRDRLASEYSAPDEGSFDLLSKGIENKKFREQCRSIVSNSYAYMAKHSLLKEPLTNSAETGALMDYLGNDRDINEFCAGSQFYSIDKEEFVKGLIRRNILKKKSGDAPFIVNLKIRNPVQFYTDFFAASPAVTAPGLSAEKIQSAADIRSLFPDFTGYIKKVSLFYNEISKGLNLKIKNNWTNENKIVREFKTGLLSYFDIQNYFHEYVSELKAGYTDALRDFSKISAGRNYFRNAIGLLSGGYKEFNAGTRTFFYGGDYQAFLNQLAHDALFDGIFGKSAVYLGGQKDFTDFETGYKKVYQQMVLDFSDLMKQYKSIRSRLPDFNKYDICFKKEADDWPQLLTRDRKKTLKESVADRIIDTLTDEEFFNGFLDYDSLRKTVGSELTKHDSGIDLSGIMISEAGPNSFSIRIGDLGYHVRDNSLVYELKRVRVIENNLWMVFSTGTKIPESFVDKIDLTETDTLTIPDSFNKMLSENKLVRGDYYDDVVMLYPGRVLLFKHGSTDNSTKYDNNLKRLSVLDYSGGKFIIRNDDLAQLNKLNDLFNEKIDAIYSYYDEKKKETELIVNTRNNVLFLRYNKNGFVRTSREESLLKNSFIFTEGLNKFVFKYRLKGY